MNVIVWTQPNGTLAVCIPTGEVPLSQVMANDVPGNVSPLVADTADFPVPMTDPFFDAIRLTDAQKFTMDLDAARAITTARINEQAAKEARRRSDLNAIGLPVTPDDATWLAALNATRASITAAPDLETLRSLYIAS